MKKICIGALAHVDAGKTTLSESILYKTNVIRNKGRVDHQDTFLDTNILEKEKGITIFNKQASFDYKNTSFTYLDTPGHSELSYEAGRVIKVLDAAILILSAIEDIPSDTIKQFNNLKQYNIPILVFVNKMDITHFSKEEILSKIKDKLDKDCILASETYEHISLLSDELLDQYLETGKVETEIVNESLNQHLLYPIFFGSALKDDGVDELLDYLNEFVNPVFDENCGLNAYTFKVNNEYAFLKIISGKLLNKTTFNDEKINGIYKVNGDNYQLVQEAGTGDVVAVKGLNLSIGTYIPSFMSDDATKNISLTYRIICDLDANELYRKLGPLNAQFPELDINLDSRYVYISLNGELHKTIIQRLIKDNLDLDVYFSDPIIRYKETIVEQVFGVGHFEPLRHYGEVVVRLTPNSNGLRINSLVHNSFTGSLLTYLNTYQSRGILTNSPLTNLEITIVDIKTHIKHTEGHDLIESLRRAIRQALTKVESKVLEPFYLTTIQSDSVSASKIYSELSSNNFTYTIIKDDIVAKIPQIEFNTFITNLKSKLKGNLNYSIDELVYDDARNQEEIIEKIHYSYITDFHNPAGSVFTKAGAGHYVEPSQVEEMMHLNMADYTDKVVTHTKHNKTTINEEELKRVWNNLYKPRERYIPKVTKDDSPMPVKLTPSKPIIYLIDGYNLMHYKNDELANDDFMNARNQVIEIVCDYCGYIAADCVLVFDAYKNEYAASQVSEYDNITIVYTKKNETADTYIENKSKELNKEYKVIVVTSDALEQFKAFANDSSIISCREFFMRYENFRNNNTHLNNKISYKPLSELKKLLIEE